MVGDTGKFLDHLKTFTIPTTRPQVELEKDHPGTTIIPLVISTDKTQLTLFENKTTNPPTLSISPLGTSQKKFDTNHPSTPKPYSVISSPLG